MLDGKTLAAGLLLPAALVFLCMAAARADDIGAAGTSSGPPSGITPVSIKLQTVLDANDAATGRAAHKSITHVQERNVTAYGLSGKYREIAAGLHYTDDMKSTLTLGPFVRNTSTSFSTTITI